MKNKNDKSGLIQLLSYVNKGVLSSNVFLVSFYDLDEVLNHIST